MRRERRAEAPVEADPQRDAVLVQSEEAAKAEAGVRTKKRNEVAVAVVRRIMVLKKKMKNEEVAVEVEEEREVNQEAEALQEDQAGQGPDQGQDQEEDEVVVKVEVTVVVVVVVLVIVSNQLQQKFLVFSVWVRERQKIRSKIFSQNMEKYLDLIWLLIDKLEDQKDLHSFIMTVYHKRQKQKSTAMIWWSMDERSEPIIRWR